MLYALAVFPSGSSVADVKSRILMKNVFSFYQKTILEVDSPNTHTVHIQSQMILATGGCVVGHRGARGPRALRLLRVQAPV